MKKIIACFLAICMLLCVCACSSENAETTQQTEPTQAKPQELKAGYARVDVTPDESVPLTGYGNSSQRMSKGVLHRTYMTCLALADENGNTVLLISTDYCVVNNILNGTRKWISKATGIAEDRIVVSACHSHAAIDLANSMECITRYNMKLGKWAEELAKAALEDMKTAELFVGSVETENMNFVKHYKAKDKTTGEITVIGDNFGTIAGKEYVGHATEVDPTMHLLKITREGEKDIILSNWRAHPHLDSRTDKSNLSSDYIGAFREAMEEKMDCDFIYFQGASGNINAFSRISTEGYTKECTEYGKLLADQASKGLENMTKVEGSAIKTKQISYEAKVDHSMDVIYDQALQIANYWATYNNAKEATKMGEPYGIRSPYHANAIVGRVSLGESMTLELDVITIADTIGIVTAPGELFDTNSAWLEAQAPYDMVLTFGYTNGHVGYFPSAIAFEYTSYETDITKYVPGTAEKIQETFLAALKELKGA